MLVNVDWRFRYPDASVANLPRTYSDHSPLVLNIEGMNYNFSPNVRNRPFRFLASWPDHDDFENFVNNVRVRNDNLHNNLQNLTSKVKIWNKELFGNIFHNKKRIKARLNGIQAVQERQFSYNLNTLEKSLRKDFQNILKQEEML